MSSQTRRILIADDHDAVRRGIRALLGTRPYPQIVGEAASGRMALEQARLTEPDIAIVDYSLSELNGLDLALTLKREMPRIEVLIYHARPRGTGARRVSCRRERLRPQVRCRASFPGSGNALSLHRSYVSGVVSEKLLEQLLGAPRAELGTLTHREREEVQLVAEGRLNKEIAHMIDLSVKTVETPRAAAMHKLQLRNVAQLVRYARRNNITPV